MAQIAVQVTGNGKSVKDAIVKIQAAPGRKELGAGVTDMNGQCDLKIAKPTPKGIYLIVYPPDDSGFAVFADIFDYETIIKKDKGVIMVRLRKER